MEADECDIKSSPVNSTASKQSPVQDEQYQSTNSIASSTSQIKGADSCWSWVVVFGSFVSYFIADGWSFSIGIFFEELLQIFGQSRATTSMVATLLYGLPLLISPFVCSLINLYGCRAVGISGGVVLSVCFILASFLSSFEMLTFTLGVVSSYGLSASYLSAIFAVSFYFKKRRGLAIGLAVTGSGIGAFCMPTLIEWLFRVCGWRGSLLLMGGISLHIVPASLLFRPLPSVVKEKPTESEEESQRRRFIDFGRRFFEPFCLMFNKSLENHWPYLLFCTSTFLLYLWIGAPFVYIVDTSVTSIHVSTAWASLLLSIIGITRTVGQVILGFLGDIRWIGAYRLYALSILIVGVSTCFVPLCKSYSSFAVYASIFGFFFSSTYVLQMLCIYALVGDTYVTPAFGAFQLVQGIATLLGTPLAGWMYDLSGSYNTSFYIAGGFMTFSSILLLPLLKQKRHSLNL